MNALLQDRNSGIVITGSIVQAVFVGAGLKSAPTAEKGELKMKRAVFGYELVMDLSECDIKVLSSKKKLKEYTDKLCKLIKMKKYGRTLLPYFGEKVSYTKGYSLVQLIETSSITGHFSEHWNKAYINIFSCKKYSATLAKSFTKKFFKAKKLKAVLLTR